MLLQFPFQFDEWAKRAMDFLNPIEILIFFLNPSQHKKDTTMRIKNFNPKKSELYFIYHWNTTREILLNSERITDVVSKKSQILLQIRSLEIIQDLERTWCECDLCTFLEVFKLLVFWGVIISPDVAFRSFFFCRIMDCNFSIPSSRPSPVTAHVGCKCHCAPENSFLRPKAASILQTSKAEGKSCLLAKMRIGMLLLLPFLHIFNNSNLASSIRSSLVESITKMMPSVQRV